MIKGNEFREWDLKNIIGVVPGVDGELLSYNGSINNATTDVLTVPTGYQYWLTSVAIQADTDADGDIFYAYERTSAGLTQYKYYHFVRHLSDPQSLLTAFPFPHVLSAGDCIRISATGSAAANLRFSATYYKVAT